MDFKYFILLFIVRKKYQTAKMLRAELINYTFYYRLVSSKVNTHDVKSSEYRKFKEKHYPFFEHKNREIVDIL